MRTESSVPAKGVERHHTEQEHAMILWFETEFHVAEASPKLDI